MAANLDSEYILMKWLRYPATRYFRNFVVQSKINNQNDCSQISMKIYDKLRRKTFPSLIVLYENTSLARPLGCNNCNVIICQAMEFC